MDPPDMPLPDCRQLVGSRFGAWGNRIRNARWTIRADQSQTLLHAMRGMIWTGADLHLRNPRKYVRKLVRFVPTAWLCPTRRICPTRMVVGQGGPVVMG